MNDQAKIIKDEARNAISTGAAAAAGAVVTGAVVPAAATAGLLAAVPAMLAGVVGVARTWKENDAKKWWYHVIYGKEDDEQTAEEVAGKIAAGIGDPIVRETILRGVRAVLETPEECCVLPLALLTREYLRENKPTDFFFRGSCGVLTWCSRSDFQQLREISEVVNRCFADSTIGFVRLEAGKLREGLVDIVDEHNRSHHVQAPDAARIIRKLYAEELATEIGAMDKGRDDNFAHARLRRAIGGRFTKLVTA